MTVYYEDDAVTLHHGDCIEVMRSMPGASVDAVVTDPPYGLEFMGKEWDAPWQESDVNADAGFHGGGISQTAGLPSFTGSSNPKCLNCRGTRRGRRDGTAKVAVCLCVDGGRFPNTRAVEMRAFGEWCEAWATECLRVLKPGGHLLAFGGTRTWHRLACAVEDAGFEVRDSIAWLYGSGFPKSLDVSKAIDKGNGVNRDRQFEFTAWMRSTGITPAQINEATGTHMGHHYTTHPTQPSIATADLFDLLRPLLPDVPERIERLVAERTGIEWTDYVRRPVTGSHSAGVARGASGVRAGGEGKERRDAPATPDAVRWQGWGTALKPAHEPVVVARKPLAGTVAANVLAYGTGALNIDACRIGSDGGTRGAEAGPKGLAYGDGLNGVRGTPTPGQGRWPANVVLDESQAEALDEQSGESTSQGGSRTASRGATQGASNGGMQGGYNLGAGGDYQPYGDSGGASRFFYVAKADRNERPKVGGVAHPTVKPLDLMRWLVRLVTPPGGTVLEPFAGSGTTVEACLIEGFQCVAIEKGDEHMPLIESRITRRRDPVRHVELTGADPGLFDFLGGEAS